MISRLISDLREVFGREKISVCGSTISPFQYAYLFGDVAHACGSDQRAIARHYRTYGKNELLSCRRWPDRDLLAEVRLQRLGKFSDIAPTGSFHVQMGSNNKLDIIFAGQHDVWSRTRVYALPKTTANTRLFIRPVQAKVEGIAGSIEETIDWLQAIIKQFNPSSIRTVGFADSSFLTLCCAATLNFDRIVIIDGRLLLPQRKTSEPTAAANAQRQLNHLISKTDNRLRLIYPAYSASSIQDAVAAMSKGASSITYVKAAQASSSVVNWVALLDEDDYLPEQIARAKAINPPADFLRLAAGAVAEKSVDSEHVSLTDLARLLESFPNEQSLEQWTSRVNAIEWMRTDGHRHELRSSADGSVKADSPVPITIAGHSHTIAISRHPNGTPTSELIKLNRFERLQALIGPWPRTDQYWDQLKHLATESSIALQWGGSEHMKYLFQSEPPLDFVTNDTPEWPVEQSFALVPQAAVRDEFRSLLAPLDQLLGELKPVSRHGIAVVGSPPPKPDDDFLRARLSKEPIFIDWLRDRGMTAEEVEFTRPIIRLKLWKTLQDAFAELAKKHGVLFIEVPPAGKDEKGFLARSFWAGDVTHADFGYGDIMAAEILRTFAGAVSDAKSPV